MEGEKPLLIQDGREYFNIGEVCRFTQVPAYTLRYWETLFRGLKPMRQQGGHRRYSRQDLQTILQIKDLLHNQKMTAAGARKALRARGSGRAQGGGSALASGALARILHQARQELEHVLQDLQ